MKTIKLSDMSREEKINMFIQMASGHSKEVEIFDVLSVMTTYSISNETTLNYGLEEYDTQGLQELLLLGLEGETINDEEERAWNTILDTVSSAQVFDIIDKPDEYIQGYGSIRYQIEDFETYLIKRWVTAGQMPYIKGES